MSTSPPPSKPPQGTGDAAAGTSPPAPASAASPVPLSGPEKVSSAELPLSALASSSNLPAISVSAPLSSPQADPASPAAATAVGASEHAAAAHAGAVHGGGSVADAGHGHGHGHGHLSPRQRLFNLLSLESTDIWIVVIYAVTIGLLSLATPIAVQSLINQVSFGVLLQPVVLLTLMLFIGLLVVGVLHLLQTSVVEILQARLFVRLGTDLVARLTHRSYHALDDRDGREVITRLFDITTVQKAVASLLLDGLGVVLQVLIGLFILAFYHPLLLAFAGALLVCAAVVIFLLGRGALTTSIRESRAKYAVSDWLVQVMFQPLAFKAGRGPTLAHQRADQLLHEYVRARRDHFRVLLRQIGGLLLIQALASAALLGIGGALVIGRQLTIGQLVASEIIVSGVVAALAKFGKHLDSLYDLLASLDKLGHLLDIELEPLDNPLRPPNRVLSSGEPGMRVAFHRVSLGYPGQPTVLSDIQLQIEPGECVGIVAAAGMGKSLLSAALYGLVPVRHGLLEIDGLSLRDVYLPALRQHVVLLRGEASEIFTGTLEENIVCGRGDVSPAELRSVLLSVGLWEELQSDPQGLRRRIQSGGAILSQQQRQRLLAARALLLQPRLLLIDGAALAHVEREPDWLLQLHQGPGRPTVLLFLPPGSPLITACQRLYTISGGQVLSLATGQNLSAQGGADVGRSL